MHCRRVERNVNRQGYAQIQLKGDRMMNQKQLAIALILVCLAACSPDETSNPETKSVPGSDRDAYGCIASAGYMWCERSNQCERPWELAKENGFESTEAEFEAYCAG